MIQATLNLYKAAVDNFLPTPTKSHYVFNLRDFARVIFGTMLIPKNLMGSEGDKLTRLWIHEVYRVFYDRLVDSKDRETFFGIVKDVTLDTFKTPIDKVLKRLVTPGNDIYVLETIELFINTCCTTSTH